MNTSKKIVFIIHALSQPRCIKRVTSLYQAGFECVVYGYNRGNYDVNTYPKGIKMSVLGEMENGNSLKNLKVAKQNLNKIVKANGKDCIYYTFGLLASSLISFKGVTFLYEISDVLYAYPKYDKVRFLMKWLDKRVIKKARNVIMTSGGFQKFYGLYDSKIIILPNKVSSSLSNCDRNKLNLKVHHFRFAFIGAIRYDSVFRFAQTIGAFFPCHEFHFYGGSSEKTLQRVKSLTDSYANVLYHGAFKSPDDLSKIYNDVDVVVTCYDTESLNEKIAEPNKLYESILFCRPIIVSEGTYLADRVYEYGCGYAINPSTVDSIKSFVKSLTNEELNSVSMKEYSIEANEVIDHTDSLIAALKGIE